MKKLLPCIALCCLLVAKAFAQTTDPSPYCLPTFTQPGSNAEIDSMIYDNSDSAFNTTDVGLYNGSAYVYFNNLTPHTFTAGQSYVFTTYGFIYPSQYNGQLIVWIDANHNNVFDSSELLQWVNGFSGGFIMHLPFTVPANALNGSTRMRISLTNALFRDPCTPAGYAQGQWGEVEDYNIKIVGGVTAAVSTVATDDFSIFPNPASDVVKLTMPGHINNQDVSVSVFDMQGKKVLDHNVDGNAQFSVANLPVNIYLVKVFVGNEMVKATKLLIQR